MSPLINNNTATLPGPITRQQKTGHTAGFAIGSQMTLSIHWIEKATN
jgi:hypothetical protein